MVANLDISTHTSRYIVSIAELVRNNSRGSERVFSVWKEEYSILPIIVRILCFSLNQRCFVSFNTVIFLHSPLCDGECFDADSFPIGNYALRAFLAASQYTSTSIALSPGKVLRKVLLYLPRGITTKNGSQHRTKHPTTIPRVLAAFFSLENLRRRTEK